MERHPNNGTRNARLGNVEDGPGTELAVFCSRRGDFDV